ncbi:hypothetical protein AAFF_G00148470 [Aldrovandia affinis]|uniref:Ig-like domain-containing protein n=1 Tax=Aldrovandia affinis TaxID=143900 RepID=A0AAD7W903_9TELE|nr:hypothetical protein AAFF_G00148470 [Aldrovandia affinis]
MFYLVALCCAFVGFTDALEVTVLERRVTGVRGQPTILGCSYSLPSGNLDNLVVTWQRVEDNQVVHSFYYGQDQLDLQSPNYRNRTSLYRSQLQTGNASLRLDRVCPRDSGRYLCSVSSQKGTDKAEVQLEYAAFYTEPRLSILVLPTSFSLQFESEGYPAPEVQWTDSAGQNLSHHQEVSGLGSDGLLFLRTRLAVEAPDLEVNLSFTLKNAALEQVLERPVSFRQDPALGPCTGGTIVATVLSVCCLLLILGVVAAYLYSRHKKTGGPRDRNGELSNALPMTFTEETNGR